MRRLIVLTLFAGIASTAAAQQYRWIDERGRVQYSDVPPPASARDVKRVVRPSTPAQSAAEVELGRVQQRAPVVLYTHPVCVEACQMARDALNGRGVPFREIVVAGPTEMEELRAKSGAANVPVLAVGAAVETTVSVEAYDAALDAAGYPKRGSLAARSQPPAAVPKPEALRTTAAGDKPAAPPAPASPPAEESPRGPYSPAPSAPPAPAAASKAR